MKRLVQVVVTAAVLLLGICIGVAADLDSTLMAVLTVIGAVVALIAVESIFAKRAKAEQAHIQIDEKNNAITVLQRGAVSRSYLHCGEYLPASAGLPRTNKYYIYTKDYDRKVVIIDKIFLSPELLAEAKKNSTMVKFVVKDHLELRHNNADSRLTDLEAEVLKQAIMTRNQSVQTHITHRAHMASRLSKAECQAVMEWIAGA